MYQAWLCELRMQRAHVEKRLVVEVGVATRTQVKHLEASRLILKAKNSC